MEEITGFTQIPNEIIFNRDISAAIFRTYVAFKSFKYGVAGRVFPSQARIAQLLGCSRETVNKHVKKLKDLKIFKVKKRGYSASNEYFFNSEKRFTHPPQKYVKGFTSIGEILSPLRYQKSHTNNTKDKNTKENKSYQDFEPIDPRVTKKGIEMLRKKLRELGVKKKEEE